MKNTIEMRQKRASIIEQGRVILDKAELEKRELTAEENTNYEKAMTDAGNFSKEIEREERQQALERSAGEVTPPKIDKTATDEQRAKAEKTAEIRTAFSNGLRTGDFRGYAAMPEIEARALSMGTSTQAGYLVSPEQFVATLIKDLDNLFFIRQYATKYTIAGTQSLGFPKRTARAAAAKRGTELSAPTPDTTLAFGKREFRPKYMTAEILVSKPLLQNAAIDPEALVRAELAYAFAVTQETEFMIGNGAEEALGIFVASDLGISTLRDVTTGTALLIKFDDLINMKYSMKQQYWKNLKWIFHRDSIKMIAKIKDGEGQYIWRQSVRDGEADMLLGVPFLMSEYAPNTYTTGLYTGILGDLSNYWIADSLDMSIQALFELYARTNQVDFIARGATDGMPVMDDGFSRLRML